MIVKKRFFSTLIAIGILTLLMASFSGCGVGKDITSGSTWEVPATTRLTKLTVADGATIKAPEGYSLSMTVDSVQKDILPGKYKGDIVLTVAENNVVKFSEKLTHYFRQALYVGKDGVVESKSVKSAVKGGEITATGAKNISISSEGENFNGIYVADGASYTVEGAKIDFTGNGSNDFAGYGAAVMSTGKNTVLILDHSDIKTKGVVRTGVIAGEGSSLIVKNSKIQALDGVLPSDYVPNGTPGFMWTGPWVLGIAGNVRATSIIGNGPTATYINSEIITQGWGALSTDSCRNARLFAINSKVLTQDNGYGTYSDGNSTTNSFYGSQIDVVDYAAITTGGTVNYAASTPEKVTELNTRLKLGLTDAELKAIKEQQTVVNSDRFGVMFHINKGTLNISDGTIFNTKKAVFLFRGNAAEVNVDGSKGARLNPENGIIGQAMDRDRAPTLKDPVSGKSLLTTDYTEPFAAYADVKKDDTHDVTADGSSEIVCNYRNIELKGNFYNGITGIKGDAAYLSKNLVLNLMSSKVTGVISSSFSRHPKSSFGIIDVKLIGEVDNIPCAAINNGVIVSLDATSRWTVTGASYLTKLVISNGAIVTAPDGKKLTMTVNGVAKPIEAGTYTGAIVLTVV